VKEKREKGLKAAQDNGDNRFQPRGFTGSKQFGILRGTLQCSRIFSKISLSKFVIGAMMQRSTLSRVDRVNQKGDYRCR
jgi:hypothetical protein